MAKESIPDFLNDRTRLAVKLGVRERGGWFHRAACVPLHTAALALRPDGPPLHLLEGAPLPAGADLVLAKRGVHVLRLSFPALPSRDGVPVAAVVAFTLELGVDRADLFRDFLRACFSFPGSYALADLETHVAPEVRRVLTEAVAARPAAGLHRADAAGLLGGALQDSLERLLFDAGVRFVRRLEASLVSEEFERGRARELRRREDARRDAESEQRRERRVKRLAGLLEDRQIQDALAGVADPKLRGLLYAKLMEDDSVQIRAEDLLSKARDCGEDVVESIYRALEGLLSHGASVTPDEVPPQRAQRVYAAAGAKVFEFDPAEDAPPRVLSFPEPLRSIRAEGPLLLGGSKHGVALLDPAGEAAPLRYPLDAGRDLKGGVNAVAMDERFIWATHSELGLARWERAKPDVHGEPLYPELTRARSTTRAVQVGSGRLLFATGPHVYAAAADGRGAVVKYVSSIESPVSCVTAAAHTIFAGTESGCILCWKADVPDQPVVLVRKRDPIVTIGLARLSGLPHLVYGARDLSLRARVIGQNLETAYETDGSPVGVVAASSDLLCGLDADGRRVHFWKTSDPARPARSLDLWRTAGKPVLDLCIRKAPARTA
jgi:hypothetical protein